MQHKLPNRRFRASADAGVLKLYIYDEIGSGFFDGVTAKDVAETLDSESFSSIELHVNSPGGDPFEATAIVNLLKNTGKPITTVIDGVAASAASIVAMAGGKVLMGEGTMLMIHNAMTGQFGNATDMRKMADTLDKVSSSMRDIYVNRSGMGGDKVQALMDAETWMTARNAVELGFADSMIDAPQTEARAIAASFDLSMYRHAPKIEEPTNTLAELELKHKHLALYR